MHTPLLTNVHNLLLFIVFRNHDDDGLWWKGGIEINGSGFHHKMNSTRLSMRRLNCTMALSIHSSQWHYIVKVGKNSKRAFDERKKIIFKALDFNAIFYSFTGRWGLEVCVDGLGQIFLMCFLLILCFGYARNYFRESFVVWWVGKKISLKNQGVDT